MSPWGHLDSHCSCCPLLLWNLLGLLGYPQLFLGAAVTTEADALSEQNLLSVLSAHWLLLDVFTH